VLILEGRGGAAARQPLQLDAVIGTAKMTFTGAVTDPLHLTGLKGHFEAGGPSLDAAGEPLGVTLPVTPVFSTAGTLVKDGTVWKVVVDHADIGSSKLSGAFTFDKRGEYWKG
jgi:AsmA family protein